jgi:Tripartite tricarboxylate transporter family receptor
MSALTPLLGTSGPTDQLFIGYLAEDADQKFLARAKLLFEPALFIDWCRWRWRLRFGVGSISHFACVILLSALKQNVTHVPYRGVAPAMNDLMGGHIDVMCDQSTTSLPQVAGGKVKALAVLTDRKLAQLPDVATASSFGYGDVNIRAWNALFAPRGTPAPIIKRLNDALRAAVADADLRRQMEAVGVDLPAPEQLAPGTVSELIAIGLARDVPALRARGEYLD